MHRSSYVELERAAGPEGSSRERVSRFTFCSVGPDASKNRGGGKTLVCPLLLSFCVRGGDYCNTAEWITPANTAQTSCLVWFLVNFMFLVSLYSTLDINIILFFYHLLYLPSLLFSRHRKGGDLIPDASSWTNKSYGPIVTHVWKGIQEIKQRNANYANNESWLTGRHSWWCSFFRRVHLNHF